MRRLPSQNRFFVLGALAAAGALLTGIYAAGTGAQTSGSAKPADLAAVKKKLDTYSAVPKFVVPNVPFAASQAAGKTVFNLPVSSHVPFNQDWEAAFAKILKGFGVKYINFPNQASPTEWVQGMQQAVNRKVDLINLQGTDPSLLGPQVAAANRAKIPVVANIVLNKTMPKPKTLAAVVRTDWGLIGELMADWMIWDTKGKGNIVIVDSADIPIAKLISNPAKAEIKRYCPSCKVTVVNVPVPEWTTKMQGAVQSALVKDPTVNYVMPLFDSEILWVIPAIKAAGMTGKVHIAASNGTAFAMKEMRTGDYLRADVAQNPSVLAHANADAVLRVLTGQKPLDNVPAPLRLFTKANVKDAGPSGTGGFGAAYQKGYEKLWSGK
jgi:ribose transport system substrate-binding protein